MPVERINEVINSLKEHFKKKYGVGDKPPSVIVGYTAAYALALHENVGMRWRGLPRDRSVRVSGLNHSGRIARTGYNPNEKKGLFWGPDGQAKFLEQPARELSQEIANIVLKALGNGATLIEALYLAGLYLQRKSQELVPIDTGNLRASAFTRKEE